MALTISHRCQNIAPSPTLAIDARAKEMKAAGVDVIGFGAGEPDFPTPAYICDAAKEALDKGMTRYPRCRHGCAASGDLRQAGARQPSALYAVGHYRFLRREA